MPSGTLTGVTNGRPDQLHLHRTRRGETLAIIQAAGLAALDNPANEESYADIAAGDLGAAADGSGDLNVDVDHITT